MNGISRGKNSSQLTILSEGRVKFVSSRSFFREHHINSIIRLRSDNFKQISSRQKYLTHFNLQKSGHKVDQRYALPLIVKPGYYEDGKEVLPVLSFERCLVGECIEVRENVSYDGLKDTDFKYSFPGIKTVAQLKRAILHRYRQSMPQLSEEKILSLGVSITKLKIMGKMKKY